MLESLQIDLALQGGGAHGAVGKSQSHVHMVAGADNTYKLVKDYKIRTAFSTDTLFDAKLA